MWRRCRGLTGVPVLVEVQVEFSLRRAPGLQCMLLAADSRVSNAGSAAQSQHNQRPALASSHSFHSQATYSQRLLPATAQGYRARGKYAPCECRSASHWGQVRSCQTPAAAAELDEAAQPQGPPAATEEAVLRSSVAVEIADTLPSDSSSISPVASEAQSQPEEPPDVFELAAAEAIVHAPLSALDAARSLSASQSQGSAVRPKHGRPSRISPSSSSEASSPKDDRITALGGLEQMAGRTPSGNELASLEQGVEDPGARTSDGWEDYISIVRARRKAAAADESGLDVEGGVPAEVMAVHRGMGAVRKMQSWKDMADWLREYSNHWFLKPTEISRMWTQIVQLHMAPGRLGKTDERKMIYPDAPFFSPGGRAFLKSLTRATRKRLQLTLRLIEPTKDEYWEACRMRSPDAGRMMWAMGKLQWQSSKLLKLLEAVAVQDIACEWNRPRYMTTALWGSAWSAPGIPLKKLCNALQKLPDEFWNRGTNAQNVCNMAWAMSMMRFQPSEQFATFLQTTLERVIVKQPRTIHPQNIGDMVQALAVMRREPQQRLLDASDTWMRANVHRLLPNHTVAYLNGLGLMRKLTHEQYKFFGQSLENNISRVKEEDNDVFAQRIFVLRRLTAPDATPATSQSAYADLSGFKGDDLLVSNQFLSNMESRGCTIVQEMLLHSAKNIEEDGSTAAVRDLLASVGYDSTVGPLEAAREAQSSDTDAAATPLLPELFVRTRQQNVPEGSLGDADVIQEGPCVALQLITASDCFCNAKTRDFDAVLGETALVRTMLCDRGLPVTEIFVEELLSLSSVDEMQAVLRDKLEPMLPPGYHGAVPALEEVQLHGHEDEDDTRGVEEVPVVGNVVEKEDLLELKRVADKEEASEHSKGTKTMHADVDTVSDTLHVQVDEQGGVLGDQLEEPSPQGGVKLGEVEGVKGADERSVVHTHEGVDGEVVAQRGAG